MNRRRFVVTLMGGILGMNTIKELLSSTDELTTQPTLFLGHGSPMNIIYKNQFTDFFKSLGQSLSRPKVILVISAHWLTFGTQVVNVEKPKQIFDFYGFPRELYSIGYLPPGSPQIANDIAKMNHNISTSEAWGLDHGSWSILHHMYPKQDVPVLQISIDRKLTPLEHLGLARQLKSLRKKGVLVIGSGNLVHNLSQVDFNPEAKAFDWALEFEEQAIQILQSDRSSEEKINEIFSGKLFNLAHPSIEHLLPLIYALGVGDEATQARTLIRGVQNSSISMASLSWG